MQKHYTDKQLLRRNAVLRALALVCSEKGKNRTAGLNIFEAFFSFYAWAGGGSRVLPKPLKFGSKIPIFSEFVKSSFIPFATF